MTPKRTHVVLHSFQFRVRNDKAVSDWLEVNERIAEWSRDQRGFRLRTLSETDDGKWLLNVYWTSMEEAAAAEERFQNEMLERVAPFIDMASVSTSYSDVHLMTYE